jgi:hypothetical protein
MKHWRISAIAFALLALPAAAHAQQAVDVEYTAKIKD